MRKGPSSHKLGFFAKFGSAVIAVEAAAFLGSYYIWRKLNRDQECRFKAYNSYPWALEAYYQLGETIDPQNCIREYDLQSWRDSGRLPV